MKKILANKVGARNILLYLRVLVILKLRREQNKDLVVLPVNAVKAGSGCQALESTQSQGIGFEAAITGLMSM